jgi:DNA (cytosine-5)-methyltransferase 1
VKALDLFCSAGGAGEGYRRAGFAVTGVDLVKRACGYPAGELIVGDCLDVMADVAFLRSFDLIHASPPCQTHSRTQHLRDAQGKGTDKVDLIPETRAALRDAGVPYVIENVEGSPLRPDLTLCGSMFPELHINDDTGRRWLKRHRIFESRLLLSPPRPCDHRGAGVRPLGVYGSMSDDIPSGGQTCRSVEEARALMGCPWMSWKALTEAIPPAYTEHIGRQAAMQLERAA